jgi:hypothetical protein
MSTEKAANPMLVDAASDVPSAARTLSDTERYELPNGRRRCRIGSDAPTGLTIRPVDYRLGAGPRLFLLTGSRGHHRSPGCDERVSRGGSTVGLGRVPSSERCHHAQAARVVCRRYRRATGMVTIRTGIAHAQDHHPKNSRARWNAITAA